MAKSKQDNRRTVRYSEAILDAAERHGAKHDRTPLWVLNHWSEVGAATEGVQLFDVDGVQPIKVGEWRYPHGLTIGDEVTWEESRGTVVAVGPSWVGVEMETGAMVTAAVGEVERVS